MRRILIVDDDDDARTMLGKLLGIAGHEIIFAANGWEALLTLDRTPIDVILLDLMMPGMDGPTFLGILRQSQRNSKLPVVIITALDFGSVSKAVSRLGIEAFLMKNDDLFNKLPMVVERALAAGDGKAAQPPA